MSEVSGPGPYSQRTDMGATGGVLSPNNPLYGEVADLQNLKSAAGGGAAPTGAAPAGGSGVDLSQVTPLGAPSAMPDQHVTTGSTAVPGQAPSAHDQDKVDVRALPPALVNAMIYQASQPGASPTFQRYVREIYSIR